MGKRKTLGPLLHATQSTMAVLACSLGLGACNSQQERMSAALDRYVGQTVADFAADHGDPTSTVETGDRKSAFRWVITGPGVGAVVPVGSALMVDPAGERQCTVVLNATTANGGQPALKDWTIVSGRWNGAC
jgi:hypothetical protein